MPSHTQPRVVIVGAGIGGLTGALCLAQQGMASTVFERAAVLAEAGAGVQLSPNAMRVLDGLGLGEAIRAVACVPQAARIRRASDQRMLLEMPLGAQAEARWGSAYLQIHRADLQTILVDAVRASPAIELRLDTGVDDIDNGDTLCLASGARLSADVIVIADGIRSRLRHRVSPTDGTPQPSGDIAWRALIPAAELPASIKHLVADQTGVWTARRRHFVHYPVRAGQLINLVGVSEVVQEVSENWHQPGDPAIFAALFADWPEPVATLTRAAHSVGCWALHHRPPAHRMARGRLALLGDAAHPVLPFMAQGAAMAIEDGRALADALAGATPGIDTIDARLQAYQRRRLQRVRQTQRASTRNARLFHLPDALAGAAFGAAQWRNRGESRHNMRRLDWLYGGGPA